MRSWISSMNYIQNYTNPVTPMLECTTISTLMDAAVSMSVPRKRKYRIHIIARTLLHIHSLGR